MLASTAAQYIHPELILYFNTLWLLTDALLTQTLHNAQRLHTQSEEAMHCLSLLPHQPAPPCVYMRGPSRFGSPPRAQMLSVNTEIPERKQGFTAAGCTHSQYRQRPGARRAQPAPHKHRPPRILSEPLVLLPDSGWVWFRMS